MEADDLFVFSEEPTAEEEMPKYPEKLPCPFCGGKAHLQMKKLSEHWKYKDSEEFGKIRISERKVRRTVYVFCGRCKARGPIEVKTLYYPGATYRDVANMEVEAIRNWNERRNQK